ncbi:hypothetical protein LTR10_010133 [Elasticomyces elasticus]|nr:hypothetical protein LTR10_010133 [Elasticomyces elasticus]KAK4972038.1 hypothetical protein LTR42_006543 [Elasticomyces elasticus]
MSLPAETRSWTTNLDGISSLKLATSRTPTATDLQPGQILVKILVVSLNYKDAEIINGLFKHHKSSIAPPDLIPCGDSVGVVVAIGGSDGPANQDFTPSFSFAPGDRVLSVAYPLYATGPALPKYLAAGVGSAVNGVLTEYRIFPPEGLVRCPSHLSDAEACTLPIAGTTAWMALRWQLPLVHVPEPFQILKIGGDSTDTDSRPTLLLQGTGGVSIFGLQFGLALGYRCFLTSSSDDKLARARSLYPAGLRDADLINYRTTPQWSTTVQEATHGHGADLIFENGGAATTPQSFACVAFGGTIASIGYVSGKYDQIQSLAENDVGRLNINVLALSKNATIKGMLNGPKDRLEEMLRFVQHHQIRPVVDVVYPFEEVREALSYLWEGRHFGKVVIRVSK